jgi:predicted amidophosphoribosyltransferase
VGAEPVVACEGCGHPLPADASFCANCGRAVETGEAEAEAEPPEPQPVDDTVLHSADQQER